MNSNYIRNFQKITGNVKKELIYRRSFGFFLTIVLFSFASYFRYTGQRSMQTIFLVTDFLFEAFLGFFYNAHLLHTNYKQLLHILETAISNNKKITTPNSDENTNLES